MRTAMQLDGEDFPAAFPIGNTAASLRVEMQVSLSRSTPPLLLPWANAYRMGSSGRGSTNELEL